MREIPGFTEAIDATGARRHLTQKNKTRCLGEPRKLPESNALESGPGYTRTADLTLFRQSRNRPNHDILPYLSPVGRTVCRSRAGDH